MTKSTTIFRDRQSAGEQLASVLVSALEREPEGTKLTLFALPRGGIPVAVPVGQHLEIPVGVAIAKKISLPPNEELAIGAVTPSGEVLWARSLRRRPSGEAVAQAVKKAREKAQSQQEQFAPHYPDLAPEGAIAILIDDGIATGTTIATAAKAVRARNPAQIWLAVPLAPVEFARHLPETVDRLVVLATPEPFLNVGRFYEQFPQVEMEEAISVLRSHNQQFAI